MPTKNTRKKARPRGSVVVQAAVAGAPAAALLRRWALAASPARPSIVVRIAGAAEAKRLNRKYRARNYATNVLSFPYGNGSGDVILCHSVIRKESKQQQKSLRAHYAHLVVHGVLHLRGHDHRRRADAARMERAETRILRRLGLADPYAGDAALEWPTRPR